MKNLHSFFLLVFFIVSFSLTAQEQITMASISKGFSAGAHGAYISHENVEVHANPEFGFGYGLRLKYGFNHKMAVALSYQHYTIKSKVNNADINPYQLFEYDLVGEYIFGNSTWQLRPSVQAGINSTNTKEGYEYAEYQGFQNVRTTEEYFAIAFVAAGGLSYYYSTNISIDFTLLMHTGQFTKVYLTTDIPSDTEKIKIESELFNLNAQLGFQYHF